MNNDIVTHYDRLARQYDHRWHSYVSQTLGRAIEATRLSGTERILDVGCGTGEFERMALARFPHLAMTGIDIAPGMITVAQEKLADQSQARFGIATAERLPFALETFDVVVCANVLHHVQDLQPVLQEFLRVLRPGGRLVLVDWCLDFWHCRLMHYWLRLSHPHYTQMPRLVELRDILGKLGVTIDRAAHFIAMPFYGMLWIVAEKIGCR